MPRGVRLTVLAGSGGRIEREFPRFPVRIGRNALNDLHLADPAVSQFHALLEYHEGRLALRDLGSKNGTAVPTIGRLQPNTPTYITEGHNEFYVAQFYIRAEIVELSSENRFRNPDGDRTAGFSAAAVLSDSTAQPSYPVESYPVATPVQPHEPADSDGDRTMYHRPDMPAAEELPNLADEPEPPSARTMPHGNAFGFRFAPLYEQYRRSWRELREAMDSTVAGLDGDLREQAYAELAKTFPAIVQEQEFQRFRDPPPMPSAPPAPPPPEEPSPSQHGAMVRASVAFNGLQRLAAVYLPQNHELASAEDVALFLEKIFEILDLFFRCYIPLRDGFRAFTTQLELGTTRAEGMPIVRSGPTVDDAATPVQLGAVLLDWKAPPDARYSRPTQVIEWVFADLMIHHMAMITGVMQGVKSLLSELAPATIEKSFDSPKRASAGGLQIGPFRYKQLWELYAMRHSDLADEDKETFALIFGGDFARAYSQLATETQATAAIRISSQFPTRTPSGQNPRGPQGPPQPPAMVPPIKRGR